eukprot:gene21295-23367_t
MFHKEEEKKIMEIIPTKMKTPFIGEEIMKSVRRLKNGKSPGVDNLNTELIRYGPNILCEGIAEIVNIIAETGEYPEATKEEILIPLPKPGKNPPPWSSLSHYTLISTTQNTGHQYDR